MQYVFLSLPGLVEELKGLLARMDSPCLPKIKDQSLPMPIRLAWSKHATLV